MAGKNSVNISEHKDNKCPPFKKYSKNILVRVFSIDPKTTKKQVLSIQIFCSATSFVKGYIVYLKR